MVHAPMPLGFAAWLVQELVSYAPKHDVVPSAVRAAVRIDTMT